MPQRLELALEAAPALDLRLLVLPLGAQPVALLPAVRQLPLESLQPGAGARVALLAQRLPLDLELHQAALHLVELDRQRVDLGAQLRGGLVDEIDGLVGQEAVG